VIPGSHQPYLLFPQPLVTSMYLLCCNILVSVSVCLSVACLQAEQSNKYLVYSHYDTVSARTQSADDLPEHSLQYLGLVEFDAACHSVPL